MELTLTKYETDLFNKWVVNVEYAYLCEKTTVACLKLRNGFELIGTSACVDPSNFDSELGNFYAKKDALRKLDEINGFAMQEEFNEGK